MSYNVPDEPTECLITRESWPQEALGAPVDVLGDVEAILEAAGLSVAALWPQTDATPMSRGLFYLRLDWLATYRADRWTLVPSDEVISAITRRLVKLHEKRKNALWKDVYIPAERYTYKFTPLALQTFPITRVPHRGLGPNPPEIHLAPYPKFPVLTGTTHPYPIIYKALRQFERHLGSLTDSQLVLYARMHFIRTLWYEMSGFELRASEESLVEQVEEVKREHVKIRLATREIC